MNTMKWLLRREFWEHKGGFVWAPAIAALIMVVLIAAAVALDDGAEHLRHHAHLHQSSTDAEE